MNRDDFLYKVNRVFPVEYGGKNITIIDVCFDVIKPILDTLQAERDALIAEIGILSSSARFLATREYIRADTSRDLAEGAVLGNIDSAARLVSKMTKVKEVN